MNENLYLKEKKMTSLELVRPILTMEREYLDFARDWAKSGEEITPYSARLLGQTFEKWLENTYKIETEPAGNFVPAHTYFLIGDNQRILGAVNIRHCLNEYLLYFGGHIGYGIRPSERKKGYAKRMLALALPIAKELGISRALITCDKENIVSALTIQRNGGVLENEVPEESRTTQRYWIELI
jgi:predicted acetyltransferase